MTQHGRDFERETVMLFLIQSAGIQVQKVFSALTVPLGGRRKAGSEARSWL